MKRDGFLIVVVVFTLLSAFVLYSDISNDCGSLRCIAHYVSTGERVSDSQFSENVQLFDLSDESGVSFVLKKAVSQIVSPFISSKNVLFGPGTPTEPINPVISAINPSNFPASSNIVVRIDGQNFDPDAELLVDGGIIDPSSVSFVSSTQIDYSYASGSLISGNHQFNIQNPTSGLISNSFDVSLTSNPVITSLNPQTVLTNQTTIVKIRGSDFNPAAVVFAGVPLDATTGLWILSGPGLINFTIPAGVPAGDYAIQVQNLDGALSNSVNLRINYPFTYFLTNTAPPSSIVDGSSFSVDVSVNSLVYTDHETVSLNVQAPNGLSYSFPNGNQCVPNIPSTTVQGIAYCTLPVNFIVSGLQQGTYSVILNSTSALTFVKSLRNFTLNVVSGSGPDADSDGVPDSIDKCPNTPAFVATTYGINRLNGCPLPSIFPLSASLTTNFSNVPDLFAVNDLRAGIVDQSSILFKVPINMLWLNSTGNPSYHLPFGFGPFYLNLSKNYVFLNSSRRPDLNVRAEITFYNTSLTNPVLYRDGALCQSENCSIISFDTSSGNVVANVSGFSSYSLLQGSCGDNLCSIAETCSSCAADCGPCNTGNNNGGSSGGGGGGGGGGGSGGGSRSGTVIYSAKVQCNDGVDNDGDGLIDFPNDPGCTSSEDGTEYDSNVLDTSGSDGSLDTNAETSSNSASGKIGVIFWIVLVALVAGISVILLKILRYSKNHKKFSELAQMSSSNSFNA